MLRLSTNSVLTAAPAWGAVPKPTPTAPASTATAVPTRARRPSIWCRCTDDPFRLGTIRVCARPPVRAPEANDPFPRAGDAALTPRDRGRVRDGSDARVPREVLHLDHERQHEPDVSAGEGV